MNPCAPLQGDSLWKSQKHSPLHCIYGFAYGFPSQLSQFILHVLCLVFYILRILCISLYSTLCNSVRLSYWIKGYLLTNFYLLENNCWSDRGRWNQTETTVDAASINVTGLAARQRYSFRVVAMNGVSDRVRETRSDPHTVSMEEGKL